MKASKAIYSVGLLLASTQLASADTGLVYSNDFETNSTGFTFSGPVASLVTLPTTSSPSGPTSKWLGELSNDTATLSLTGLTPGSSYTLGFDLLLNRSWDGNGPAYGPDYFRVQVDSAAPLLNATFANNASENTQSYSDSNVLNAAINTAKTGADVVGADFATYFFSHGTGNPVLSFQASSTTAQVKFSGVGLQGPSDESWSLDNVNVVGTYTPGSVPANGAGPNDPAYIYTDYTGTGPAAPPTTTSYQSLDLLGDSAYTLGPNETLNLDNGAGTLNVGPNAVFTGNGIVNGNIRNSGLVIVPITRIPTLAQVVAPSTGSGGSIYVPPPVVIVDPQQPIVIDPGPGEDFVTPAGNGVFIGYTPSGSGGGGSSGFTGTGPTYQITAPVVNSATTGWDGSLEVTGDYTQESTGITRFTIAGFEQGVTYSLLDVGGSVALDGSIQVVLKPDLFGYLPHAGETFDIILADEGITLAGDDISIDTLITTAGLGYLSGYDVHVSPFTSAFANDPDTLHDIAENLFTYQLLNGGTTMRVTFAGLTVPEPTSAVLLVGCAGMASLRRNRRSR